MPNMKQRKQFPPLDCNQVRTSLEQDRAFRSCCFPALFYNLDCCLMQSVELVDWLKEPRETIKLAL